MADLDIPELKRDQLGKGVRGKYLKHFAQGSNVVVLQPEILKAFPTSEAVNRALVSMLALAHETQVLSVRPKTTTRKRLAALTWMVDSLDREAIKLGLTRQSVVKV
jgi:hypothetical protein